MTKKLTQEEFIVRANKVHGEGRYDYSQTHYVSMRQDVTIKCNICGNIFKQNPNHHLRGAGCFECAKKRMGDRMTQEEFIEKARKVHGDKFDYSMVHYTHCRMPITIKCNVCGTIFEQPPANHLNSNGGCPTCRKKPYRVLLHMKSLCVELPKSIKGSMIIHSRYIAAGIKTSRYDALNTAYLFRKQVAIFLAVKVVQNA